MTNILIAIFAYLLDKIFGEFTFMVHPLSYVKEMSSYFKENHFKESILRGFLHLFFVISVVSFFIICITLFLAETPFVVNVVASSLIASMFLSHTKAGDSLKKLFKKAQNKQTFSKLVKHNIRVQRLNDALVAPLLYLLLFGLIGLVLYKSINLMAKEIDSKQSRLYATTARILNDGLNFLPTHFIALLIVLRNWR